MATAGVRDFDCPEIISEMQKQRAWRMQNASWLSNASRCSEETLNRTHNTEGDYDYMDQRAMRRQVHIGGRAGRKMETIIFDAEEVGNA